MKTAAIRLIRKGLTLGNVMWFDGQDLRGMDKQVLRSVGVWLFGVQSEKNEIENVMRTSRIRWGVRCSRRILGR